MRMSVVLPAPFGPRSPKTMPSGTSRSTPARAIVDPNRLTTPPTRTAGGRLPPDPLVSGCDNEVALSGWPCMLHYLLADGPDYRGAVARLDRGHRGFGTGTAHSEVARSVRRQQVIADRVAYREAVHQGCTHEP